jgi:TRAP-type C4-dicarboxylate transport system permease small subunit
MRSELNFHRSRKQGHMQTLLSWLDRTINWILALLMAAMVVVIAAQVWYRFVLNDPLSWSEELRRYLFVWISFLGAAAGVRYRVHLGIDLLQKLLPPNAYRIVVVLMNLIIQVFLVLVIYWGFRILGIIRFQTSASMNISMVYPYLAVPVGSVFMLINSLRVSAEAVMGSRPDREVRL